LYPWRSPPIEAASACFFKTTEHTHVNTIDDIIAVVTRGGPARYRGLSVYPLSQERNGAAAAYLVLDDALATGRFRITEPCTLHLTGGSSF
jgi:hypothetical protein